MQSFQIETNQIYAQVPVILNMTEQSKQLSKLLLLTMAPCHVHQLQPLSQVLFFSICVSHIAE